MIHPTRTGLGTLRFASFNPRSHSTSDPSADAAANRIIPMRYALLTFPSRCRRSASAPQSAAATSAHPTVNRIAFRRSGAAVSRSHTMCVDVTAATSVSHHTRQTNGCSLNDVHTRIR
jgi:hypothetical protein